MPDRESVSPLSSFSSKNFLMWGFHQCSRMDLTSEMIPSWTRQRESRMQGGSSLSPCAVDAEDSSCCCC